MIRILSLLAFAGLVAALFLLPVPGEGRLAALGVGELLDASVVRPEASSGAERTLIEALLASSATTRNPDGATVVRLGDVRVTSATEPAGDPVLASMARDSIRRKLRATAAGAGDDMGELVIEGTRSPVANGADFTVTLGPGTLRLAVAPPGEAPVHAEVDWTAPTRASLFPPIVAILLAVLFRRPVLALFAGVLAGAILAQYATGAGALGSVTAGLPSVFTTYLWGEFGDSERTFIILFVIFMLAMVGVLTRSGGIRGLMDLISRAATSVRHTQIATYLMGLAVFFDDYANTILVGSTMRPLTDKFRISREKLAYIVDSTAAPVAGLSIFSTWIAFEVSTFSAQLPDVGLAASDGYAIFIETLPYRFYCIFTLVFVGLIVFTGRDFGSMLTAERRARKGGLLREGATPMVGTAATALEPAAGVEPRAWRALWPLAAFIGVTLLEIARVGGAFSGAIDLLSLPGLAQVLYDGSGSKPLMIGAASGLGLAAVIAFAAGLRRDILTSAWVTLRSMGIAIVILYLAWMIGGVCRTLGTASYLSVLLGDAVPYALLPGILFVLSGVVAFSTGSSWSTMSILLPLVVGLSFNLGEPTALGGHTLMILSIGAVLEGAIFGDHCSPISDTTVMSSISSASDHIDHVRTQAPYALMTCLVALFAGYLPCTYLGLSPYAGLALGIATIVVIIFVFGRRSEPAPEEEAVPAAQP